MYNRKGGTKMKSRLKSVLDELTPSLIAEWLELREVFVVQYSDNHKLSKTESAIKKRIVSEYPIPIGTRHFFFIDAKDFSKRYIVVVNRELELTYSCYFVSDEKIEKFYEVNQNMIYPPLFQAVNYTSWTIFLIIKFGDIIWNNNFFKKLDENIIRDYIIVANLTNNPDTDILLMMENSYFKVFFFIDEKGYENRVQVNYKLDCSIFRSVSRIQDWNSGRKKPPAFTEVLGTIDFSEFSRRNYYKYVEQKMVVQELSHYS